MKLFHQVLDVMLKAYHKSIKKQLIIILCFMASSSAWADVHSDNATTIFGEQNGTNAGRYRSVKFSNGTTTNNNDGSISITNTGGGGGNVGIGTANTVTYWGPSNTLQSSNNFNFDGTNVGIGVASTANQSLNVHGRIYTDGFGAVQSDSNFNSAIGDQALPNSAGIYNMAMGAFALNQNSGGSFNVAIGVGALGNVNTDNNLGFGEAAGEALTIGTNNILIGQGFSGVAINLLDGNDNTILASDGGMSLIHGSGNILFGNGADTPTHNDANNTLNIGNTIFGNGVGLASSGNVGIGTGITGGGLVVMNGNVGVGTWIPGEALEIEGGNIGIGTNAAPTAQMTVFSNSLSSTVALISTLSSAAPAIIITADSGFGLFRINGSTTGNSTNQNIPKSAVLKTGAGMTAGLDLVAQDSSAGINFFTGGTGITANLRAIIDNNGNVGIGTSAATVPLVVQTPSGGTTMQIQGTTTGARIGYRINDTGTSNNRTDVGVIPSGGVNSNFANVPLSDIILNGAGSTGGMLFVNTTAQPFVWSQGTAFTGEAMRINSVGNVGIGTSLPLALLSVAGTGGVSIGTVNSPYIVNSPPSQGLTIQGNVGIGTWVPALPFSVTGDSYHNGNIGIGTTLTMTSALTVMNGNVGIGTWVPNQILQVKGNENISGNVIGQLTTQYQMSTMALGTISGTPSTIYLGTTTTPSLIVANSVVGIGTITPSGVINAGLQIGTDSASVANAIILCNCSTKGGVSIGICTGSLIVDSCTTCTCIPK